tara:strand:- start:21320 stop:22447 length:1128 start_codon:yes stop_codon:yes gene_type:complete
MEKITLYSIFHGRFPSEKAHGIFAAKGAEAFANEGAVVKLLVPNRRGVQKNAFSFYKIKENFSVHYLFTVDLFNSFLKKFAFRVSLLFFSVGSLLFVLFDRSKNKVIYTNEIIPAFLFGALTPYKVVYELHDFPEQNLFFYKTAFRYIDLFIATNTWKGNQLRKEFNISEERVFVELNAVEVSDFVLDVSKDDARKELGISTKEKVVVYTGHFYSWKGTDTLLAAAKKSPDIDFYFIGGTKEDVIRIKKEYSAEKNIHIVGYKPHSEIPLWQKAADILVLPNTAKEKISKYYTSPMKLFEYMASKRPIIASDLPSVREIGGESELYLVESDNPQKLAEEIYKVLESGGDKVEKAFEKIQHHTWQKRAKRILSAFI